MPFVKSNLISELEIFWDEESPNFVEKPQSDTEAGNAWADAVDVYGLNVIPSSFGAVGGRAAFLGLFSTLSKDSENGSSVFPACFDAYTDALALGMSPGFVGVGPPLSPDFTTVIAAGEGGASNAECLAIFADVLDTWFKTGTATPSSGGSPINWS